MGSYINAELSGDKPGERRGAEILRPNDGHEGVKYSQKVASV